MALEANMPMQDKVAPADGGVVNPISENMDEVARYWIEEAEEALTILQHLFEKGDYAYALFFGHLAVRKIDEGCVCFEKQGACSSHSQPAPISPGGRCLAKPGAEGTTVGADNIFQHRSPIPRPEKVVPK